MAKKTPRLELLELHEREKLNPDGYYGVNYSLINLIESRLKIQASNILKTINHGWLYGRTEHEQVYQLLLDGVSVKEIKNRMKIC